MMDSRWPIRVVALLFVVCIPLTSCVNGNPGDASSSKWVEMEGRAVFLRLPASFKGGNPSEVSTMEALDRIALSVPTGDEREYYTRWLDRIQQYDLPNLMAWASLDEEGSVACATVMSTRLQNIQAVADGDSMQALVEAYMLRHPDGSWRLEEVSESEAYATVDGDPRQDKTSGPALVLLKSIGDMFYMVSYQCPQPYWEALLPLFVESARTFQVDVPSDSPLL
jgi:hypothetical protein